MCLSSLWASRSLFQFSPHGPLSDPTWVSPPQSLRPTDASPSYPPRHSLPARRGIVPPVAALCRRTAGAVSPKTLWGERPPADCSTLVAAAVQLHLQSRRSNNIPGAPRGTIESTLGSSVHHGRCAAEDATRVRAAPRQRHGAAERATRLRAAWTTTPGGRIVRCLAFSAV